MKSRKNLDAEGRFCPPTSNPLKGRPSSARLVLAATKNLLALVPREAYQAKVLQRSVFGELITIVNTQDGIAHVLDKARLNYERHNIFRRVSRPLTGDSVLLAEGENWRKKRIKFAGAFSPKATECLEGYFEDAAEELLRSVETDGETDLFSVLHRITLRAAVRSQFGSLDNSILQRIERLTHSFLNGPSKPNLFDYLARNEASFMFANKARRAHRKEWLEIAKPLVDSRVKEIKPNQIPNDMLDILIASYTQESNGPDHAEIVDQCGTMLAAGYETAARTLFWACFLLANDLQEQNKLREEALVGNSSTNARSRSPNRMDLVLYETMRLYPSAPFLSPRVALGGDTVSGASIPAKSQVWICPWALHRHTQYWSAPCHFIPERFESVEAPWLKEYFIPFGRGPRICIGLFYAMRLMKVILAGLISRFEILLIGNPTPPIASPLLSPLRRVSFTLKPV